MVSNKLLRLRIWQGSS